MGLGLGLLVLNPWGAVFAADKPDLVVSTLGEPPGTARAGDSFALNVIVTNQGLAAAEDPSTTKFYLVVGTTKKNLNGVQAVGPLAIGGTAGGPMTLSVYSDTNPGTYTLRACADVDSDVSESLEGNNCKEATTLITILESPDLIVTSVTNPVSSAGQGEDITAKSVIKNIGPVAAGATLTKYYLVSTADQSRHDLKGLQPVDPLDDGDTFTAQGLVTIRPETAPGQYKLQSCADSEKAASEESEQNNCLTSTGNIQVTPVPDLVVTSVTVPGLPKTVVPNDSLDITVVVTNLGLVQAKASTMKFLLVNTSNGAEKNLNGTASTPVVPAGGSVQVQKTVKVYSDTASATYKVQACADSKKEIAELLESNNCRDADGTLTVQGVTPSHADLIVTAVDSLPTSVLPSASFDIGATVMNTGTDQAPASTTSFYLVNTSTGTKKNLKGGQNVGVLDPGASAAPLATLTLFSDTVPATYNLQACADGPKGVSEQNEGNNCLNAAGIITVQQVPNLVVSSITNPPSQAPLGSKFDLTSSVRNPGSVPAAASETKYYLVSTVSGARQDLKGNQAVPVLNAGQTFSSKVSLEVRPETLPGEYKAQACADGGKDVAESDEDDNCKTSSGIVKVVGPPDLTVESVTVRNAPLTVARNGTLTITAEVKNVGEGSAGTSTAKYLLVNAQGGTKNLNAAATPPQTYPVLSSGKSASRTKGVTVFGDTAFGVYTVRVCADGASPETVSEASEINNCKDTTTTVTVQ